jgi:hypothetical protein
MTAETADELSDLFWHTAGTDEAALNLILELAPGVNDQGLRNLGILIDKATSRLVFSKFSFVKQLLGLFAGKQRERLVEALAHQAYKISSGVVSGSLVDHMAQRQRQFSESLAALPDDPDLEDLLRAMRRFS